ncbi:poly(A) polymerase 2 [Striga asiatica]|uniref:Poly(A) polymerase 2 n=1 Tax=Striga asiatica TaxID=4170 RepID=A0A5A7PRG5_STRAF|nr:poly(A) polymerase 2 [Striga asiatica]
MVEILGLIKRRVLEIKTLWEFRSLQRSAEVSDLFVEVLRSGICLRHLDHKIVPIDNIATIRTQNAKSLGFLKLNDMMDLKFSTFISPFGSKSTSSIFLLMANFYKACISTLTRSPKLSVADCWLAFEAFISWTGGGLTIVIGIGVSSDRRLLSSLCSWHMAHQCKQHDCLTMPVYIPHIHQLKNSPSVIRHIVLGSIKPCSAAVPAAKASCYSLSCLTCPAQYRRPKISLKIIGSYNFPGLEHIQKSLYSKVHLQELDSFLAMAVHIHCTWGRATALSANKGSKFSME